MRTRSHPVSLACLVMCLTTGAAAAGCKRGQPDTSSQHGRVVHDAGPEPALGEHVPAGSALTASFTFGIAVYHLPRPKTDPDRVVSRSVRGRPIELRARPIEGAPKAPVMWIVKPPLDEYRPPSGDSLEFARKGLSDAEARQLQTTRSVTVLAFAGPGASATITYRHAIEIARDLAGAAGGVIWDEETRQVFSREAWAARLEDWHDGLPDIEDHIVIHSYRDGDLMRLVSLGMGKLALPDVVVNQVAASHEKSAGNLVNLTCQTLLERPALARAGELVVAVDEVKNPGARAWATKNILKGAARRATLRLSVAQPEEGDADNPLVEIAFPGPASTLQVRQVALLDQLFGSADQRKFVTHDDEVLTASRRARATLMKIKPRYLKAIPFGERLLVKSPFRMPDGGNEWMWVEVVRWRGHTIHGILDNDPFDVPDLKAGAKVEVEDSLVFDYLLTKRDGTEEGNETGRLVILQNYRERTIQDS